MSNDERVGRLVQAIENLAETSGQKEATKVIPNCRVVDADPSDIPGYIIVENELGYYVPAIKSPDITYQDDDTVNLLIIKGTEPIAFQHGTGSGTGGYPGALPLTTKGDIVTRDASDNIRLGVEENDKVLTAVSSEPSGLNWVYPSKLIAPDGDPNPAWAVDDDGNLNNPGGGALDLNGIADVLVLDADADTTISSPTDDQIDFEAGGVDIARITAAGVSVLSRVAEAVWFDYPLVDSANASGIASHFRDNTATYPAGWTETDAASETDTDSFYSFWYLRGAPAEASWKYRKLSSVSPESIGASEYLSIQFGPILFRDGDYSADLDYIFGIYRNNAGAIDENTYSRVRLHWNSASNIWQVRGEESDGSTAHDGTYITLSVPLSQPLYFRVLVQNVAGKTTRQYIGTAPVPKSHTLLFQQNPSSAPTWGTPWAQIEMSRAGGVADYLFVGSVDYVGNEA